MRIRKAEKLLGWASEYRMALPPPPPPPSDSASGLLCELSRSSWVGDSINYRREDLETANESSEIGAVGDDFKAKEKEEEKKEESGEKAEEEETEAAGVMKCKKTDGKRWHCKRAAKLPHSLCSYHLTQLRSYRARFEDQIAGDHRKKSSLPVDCGGAASNYYYYYSILGPWWGKRRGPVNGEEGGSTGCNDSSESASSPQDSNGKTGHEGSVGVDEEEGGSGSRCEEKYVKKKKRVIKRRGRKPVKSRSLKSLL